LREYNRQRTKSIDEVIREQVIDTNNDGSAYLRPWPVDIASGHPTLDLGAPGRGALIEWLARSSPRPTPTSGRPFCYSG
jgi:hypothetical protein